jgi:tRNA uracil 4-sulfurtransferase
MREVLLLKNGEIVLKGLNRPTFESILVGNIKRRLESLGASTLTRAQSAMFIEPQNDDYDIDEALSRLQKIFGLAAVSRAAVVEKDMQIIKETAASYLHETLEGVSSFKVDAKRSDKKFAFTSPQICTDVGAYLLDEFSNLHVDVHNPEVIISVEIRDFGAYIHGNAMPGAGGMPVGSNGRAAVLISGGIDSPVAAYMLAKRGVTINAIHFESPPYTSERARLKVMELLKIVSEYSGRVVCHVVPFTRIQEEIRKNCPEELFTVIMRRFMMKVACEIAKKRGCQALITGESIGQVASQTIEAISCTEEASSLPVFRPLIGMDKEEIIHIARKIGTFETSIQPYEDCCTVFTPRHPRTKPELKFLLAAESAFDFAPLLEEAVANAELVDIKPIF